MECEQGSLGCPLIRYGIRKNIDRKKESNNNSLTHSLHHDSTRMKDRELWRISLGYSRSLVDFEFSRNLKTSKIFRKSLYPCFEEIYFFNNKFLYSCSAYSLLGYIDVSYNNLKTCVQLMIQIAWT